METKSLTEFVGQFFKRSILQAYYPDFKQFDKSIIVPNIRKDVNAVITLSEAGTHGNYVGFRIEIIHKDNGEIEGKFFSFKSYLPKPLDKRIDCYYISADVKPYWYCSAPDRDDVLDMIVKMVEYIKLWA